MWKRKLDQGIPLLLNRYAIGGEFGSLPGRTPVRTGLIRPSEATSTSAASNLRAGSSRSGRSSLVQRWSQQATGLPSASGNQLPFPTASPVCSSFVGRCRALRNSGSYPNQMRATRRPASARCFLGLAYSVSAERGSADWMLSNRSDRGHAPTLPP